MAEYTKDQLMQALRNADAAGDTKAAERIAEMLQGMSTKKMPEGNAMSAVLEPIKAIGTSMAGQVVAGGAGLLELAKGRGLDKSVEAIQDIQSSAAGIAAPKTQAGQRGLERVGDLMEMGIDIAQFPISGLAGLVELVSGQGLDQAAKTVQDIQGKGVSQTAGDRTLEETGSPLLATVAYTSPEIVGSLIPIAGIAKKRGNFQRTMAARLKDAQAAPEMSQILANLQRQIDADGLTPELVNQVEKITQSATPRIQQQLARVTDDIRAGVDRGTITSQIGKIADDANNPFAERELSDYILKGSEGVKNDRLAQDAVKQGFDQGVIASVKAASPEDQAFMRQMVDMMERGKNDALYSVKNRPTDVAGNNLMNRVSYVKRINRESGSQLDKIAKSLKGQQVEFSPVVDNFLARLDDIGVKLDRNLNPIFEGSDIEMNKAAEGVIKNIVNRMKSGSAGQVPDAYDLHRLKKYIDDQVTYGKTAEGLAGKTETILKSLRREVDGLLDSNFDVYNQVNTTYADTISALDSIQSSVGGKIDLFGDNAEKALGTTLRGLMSNNKGRVQLMNAVNDLESTARKYGGNFNDNLQVQMLFADELDSVFGPVARTAFQRSVGEGVKYGFEAVTGQKTGIGMLADAGAKLADRARGINEENAFIAIKKLLERPKQ